MIFEIDNVELHFAEKLILNGIYLRAETGKITGLLGRNGCGKSSLLNIFFGSLIPRHSLIRINKKNYLRPFYNSGLVKYLPQHSFIPPFLRLALVFRLHKISWNEFTKVFPQFSQYRNSRMSSLSGGEQRLVETYLVVKSNAEIILLDEPFTHLSPVYIEKINILLRKEAKNKAVVLTDHLYHHIIEVADDIYFLTEGCTRLLKDPKDLEDLKYLNYGTL